MQPGSHDQPGLNLGVRVTQRPQADQPAGPPAFLPTRPLTATDLVTLTEQVRRRVIGWFKRQGLLDSHAAAAMLAWEPGGFQLTRASASRSSTATRRALFSVSSISSDPAPGR